MASNSSYLTGTYLDNYSGLKARRVASDAILASRLDESAGQRVHMPVPGLPLDRLHEHMIANSNSANAGNMRTQLRLVESLQTNRSSPRAVGIGFSPERAPRPIHVDEVIRGLRRATSSPRQMVPSSPSYSSASKASKGSVRWQSSPQRTSSPSTLRYVGVMAASSDLGPAHMDAPQSPLYDATGAITAGPPSPVGAPPDMGASNPATDTSAAPIAPPSPSGSTVSRFSFDSSLRRSTQSIVPQRQRPLPTLQVADASAAELVAMPGRRSFPGAAAVAAAAASQLQHGASSLLGSPGGATTAAAVQVMEALQQRSLIVPLVVRSSSAGRRYQSPSSRSTADAVTASIDVMAAALRASIGGVSSRSGSIKWPGSTTGGGGGSSTAGVRGSLDSILHSLVGPTAPVKGGGLSSAAAVGSRQQPGRGLGSSQPSWPPFASTGGAGSSTGRSSRGRYMPPSRAGGGSSSRPASAGDGRRGSAGGAAAARPLSSGSGSGRGRPTSPLMPHPWSPASSRSATVHTPVPGFRSVSVPRSVGMPVVIPTQATDSSILRNSMKSPRSSVQWSSGSAATAGTTAGTAAAAMPSAAAMSEHEHEVFTFLCQAATAQRLQSRVLSDALTVGGNYPAGEAATAAPGSPLTRTAHETSLRAWAAPVDGRTGNSAVGGRQAAQHQLQRPATASSGSGGGSSGRASLDLAETLLRSSMGSARAATAAAAASALISASERATAAAAAGAVAQAMVAALRASGSSNTGSVGGGSSTPRSLAEVLATSGAATPAMLVLLPQLLQQAQLSQASQPQQSADQLAALLQALELTTGRPWPQAPESTSQFGNRTSTDAGSTSTNNTAISSIVPPQHQGGVTKRSPPKEVRARSPNAGAGPASPSAAGGAVGSRGAGSKKGKGAADAAARPDPSAARHAGAMLAVLQEKYQRRREQRAASRSAALTSSSGGSGQSGGSAGGGVSVRSSSGLGSLTEGQPRVGSAPEGGAGTSMAGVGVKPGVTARNRYDAAGSHGSSPSGSAGGGMDSSGGGDGDCGSSCLESGWGGSSIAAPDHPSLQQHPLQQPQQPQPLQPPQAPPPRPQQQVWLQEQISLLQQQLQTHLLQQQREQQQQHQQLQHQLQQLLSVSSSLSASVDLAAATTLRYGNADPAGGGGGGGSHPSGRGSGQASQRPGGGSGGAREEGPKATPTADSGGGRGRSGGDAVPAAEAKVAAEAPSTAPVASPVAEKASSAAPVTCSAATSTEGGTASPTGSNAAFRDLHKMVYDMERLLSSMSDNAATTFAADSSNAGPSPAATAADVDVYGDGQPQRAPFGAPYQQPTVAAVEPHLEHTLSFGGGPIAAASSAATGISGSTSGTSPAGGFASSSFGGFRRGAAAQACGNAGEGVNGGVLHDVNLQRRLAIDLSNSSGGGSANATGSAGSNGSSSGGGGLTESPAWRATTAAHPFTGTWEEDHLQLSQPQYPQQRQPQQQEYHPLQQQQPPYPHPFLQRQGQQQQPHADLPYEAAATAPLPAPIIPGGVSPHRLSHPAFPASTPAPQLPPPSSSRLSPPSAVPLVPAPASSETPASSAPSQSAYSGVSASASASAADSMAEQLRLMRENIVRIEQQLWPGGTRDTASPAYTTSDLLGRPGAGAAANAAAATGITALGGSSYTSGCSRNTLSATAHVPAASAKATAAAAVASAGLGASDVAAAALSSVAAAYPATYRALMSSGGSGRYPHYGGSLECSVGTVRVSLAHEGSGGSSGSGGGGDVEQDTWLHTRRRHRPPQEPLGQPPPEPMVQSQLLQQPGQRYPGGVNSAGSGGGGGRGVAGPRQPPVAHYMDNGGYGGEDAEAMDGAAEVDREYGAFLQGIGQHHYYQQQQQQQQQPPLSYPYDLEQEQLPYVQEDVSYPHSYDAYSYESYGFDSRTSTGTGTGTGTGTDPIGRAWQRAAAAAAPSLTTTTTANHSRRGGGSGSGSASGSGSGGTTGFETLTALEWGGSQNGSGRAVAVAPPLTSIERANAIISRAELLRTSLAGAGASAAPTPLSPPPPPRQQPVAASSPGIRSPTGPGGGLVTSSAGTPRRAATPSKGGDGSGLQQPQQQLHGGRGTGGGNHGSSNTSSSRGVAWNSNPLYPVVATSAMAATTAPAAATGAALAAGGGKRGGSLGGFVNGSGSSSSRVVFGVGSSSGGAGGVTKSSRTGPAAAASGGLGKAASSGGSSGSFGSHGSGTIGATGSSNGGGAAAARLAAGGPISASGGGSLFRSSKAANTGSSRPVTTQRTLLRAAVSGSFNGSGSGSGGGSSSAGGSSHATGSSGGGGSIGGRARTPAAATAAAAASPAGVAVRHVEQLEAKLVGELGELEDALRRIRSSTAGLGKGLGLGAGKR